LYSDFNIYKYGPNLGRVNLTVSKIEIWTDTLLSDEIRRVPSMNIQCFPKIFISTNHTVVVSSFITIFHILYCTCNLYVCIYYIKCAYYSQTTTDYRTTLPLHIVHMHIMAFIYYMYTNICVRACVLLFKQDSCGVGTFSSFNYEIIAWKHEFDTDTHYYYYYYTSFIAV